MYDDFEGWCEMDWLEMLIIYAIIPFALAAIGLFWVRDKLFGR